MTDMLVKLYNLPANGLIFPENIALEVKIRKPIGAEKMWIVRWVRETFGEVWASEVEITFSRSPVSCFIAQQEKKLVGFACYDTSALGYFGPTGVDENFRGQGLGKALLLACLQEMKLKGYGYAIIGWVGPQEFYKKAVGALVIPASTPGIWQDWLGETPEEENPPDQMAVIPQPRFWQMGLGYFELNSATQIVADQALFEVAQNFAACLAPALGFQPPVRLPGGSTENTLRFRLAADLERLGPEGYRLIIENHHVDLAAATPAGIFYGTQTLRQLLPESIFSPEPVPAMQWMIPAIEIEDAPRFAWRGALLDAGRYFMPLKFIYRWIDLLALHKMNTFHWHLTEDQGWRIEIKQYPRLTEIGAWRKETLVGHLDEADPAPKFDGVQHGGFYTQDEIRAIVEYARQRFITIVPEIEMPGHAQAAIAAYPELGNTEQHLEVSTTWGIHRHVCNVEESTIQFMQNVLSEVLELFPSQFIHIGGDETPTDEWRDSPTAQQRIQELGLADETQLQGYFLRRIEEFLNSKGRRLIGWDEILTDGLSPEAAIMSWRCNGSDTATANAGREIVVAPYDHFYLDYYQLRATDRQPLAIGGYTPLSQVYQFEPVAAEITPENRKHILGIQAQLWSEYLPTPAQVEYMAFPRLCAVAELAWTPPEQKNYAKFVQRLAHHQRRLEQLKINYCPKIE